MNKYNYLLFKIATRYGIKQGTTETEPEYKARIVYSVCGMMAYAALWDEEDEGDISITHVKKRIEKILNAYVAMYPEIQNLFARDFDAIKDEILDVFLNAGAIYHSPFRILPAMRKESVIGDVILQRGIVPDEIEKVSGIGFFQKDKKRIPDNDVYEMFSIDPNDLKTSWDSIIKTAAWRLYNDNGSTNEFLRTKASFKQGYWLNETDLTEGVTLMRTGMRGAQSYYLAKFENGSMAVSPLPAWRVENMQYLELANACLARRQTLPPVDYKICGDIVYLQLNYLLPPAEMSLLKMYSWPIHCIELPNNFKRVVDTDVFHAFKAVLENKGYTFGRV